MPCTGQNISNAGASRAACCFVCRVVYTDRALNHMSEPFKKAMNNISDTCAFCRTQSLAHKNHLAAVVHRCAPPAAASPDFVVPPLLACAVKEVYNCKYAVVIPGSGTYAMEACARQFATGKKALVIRNGYFSYRWTQIFEACGIPTGAPMRASECRPPLLPESAPLAFPALTRTCMAARARRPHRPKGEAGQRGRAYERAPVGAAPHRGCRRDDPQREAWRRLCSAC